MINNRYSRDIKMEKTNDTLDIANNNEVKGLLGEGGN